MNESSTQPGTAESERPQHSALAERLLRRHAEPVGVIDVRQPQELHARTAGWVARRFGLLEHWRTRYGGHELAPPSKGEMVFNAPVAQTREAHGVVFSAHRGDSLVTPKETPVSPLLRVTRRPPTLSRAADPGSVSRSPSGVEGPRRFQTIEPAPGRSEAAITTDVPDLSRPLISRRPDDHIETALETPASEPGPPVRAPVTESPTRTQPVQTTSARPPSPVTNTNVGDRVTTSVSAVETTLARSYELSQSGQTLRSSASAVPAPTHASSPAPARETEDQVSVTAVPEKQKMQTSEAVLPLASAPLTLQRQPLVEQAGPIAKSQPLAVTAEIPATTSHESPHMIWRKSANDEVTGDRLTSGRTPLPLKIEAASSTPIIARSIVSDAIAESGESARQAYESSGRTREIDVAQLTEHVGRLLSRELEVERERRGMK